ncbi:MAG: hypothetical protein AABX33_05370 [Nanoarchaeota archaeon]
MPQKTILLNSFKESFAVIRNNKFLTALLFILQIALFATLSTLSYNYMSSIVENQKAIDDYLGKLELDETSIMSNLLQHESIVGNNPAIVMENSKKMLKNLRIYLIYIYLMLVIFASAGWAITYKLIHKLGLKKLIICFLKSFVILLLYLGLIFFFFLLLINISFAEFAAERTFSFAKYAAFLILSPVLAYFMFISLSLLDKVKLKDLIQRTLIIGIKKAHIVLMACFINASIFTLSVLLLYFFLEKNLFVLLLSAMLFIFSFVFGRIFMINFIEKLS